MVDITNEDPLRELFDYPLLEAIYGRRARRFGMGMEIPSGPLAFRSSAEPAPLTELEHAVLVAAETGVTGWNFGVPFGPDRPNSHVHYTQRFTGRTAPTAAGFGTPVLFHTDDEGTDLTNTRDTTPTAVRELDDGVDDIQRILELGRKHTTQLSDGRLDLPAQPPHMLPPNLWMANAPGSTLFMPVGDASEQVLGFLTMVIGNGNFIVDDSLHHCSKPKSRPVPCLLRTLECHHSSSGTITSSITIRPTTGGVGKPCNPAETRRAIPPRKMKPPRILKSKACLRTSVAHRRSRTP